MSYQLMVRKKVWCGSPDFPYVGALEDLFRPVQTIAAAKCDATKFVNHRNGWIPRKRDKLPPVKWKWFSCPARAPGVINSILTGTSGMFIFNIYEVKQ